MDKNSKNKILNIRVSESEFKELLEKAKLSNMNLSTYLRAKISFDDNRAEKYNFEYKVLKGISYILGAVRIKTEDQKEEIIKEAKRIMKINGIGVD